MVWGLLLVLRPNIYIYICRPNIYTCTRTRTHYQSTQYVYSHEDWLSTHIARYWISCKEPRPFNISQLAKCCVIILNKNSFDIRFHLHDVSWVYLYITGCILKYMCNWNDLFTNPMRHFSLLVTWVEHVTHEALKTADHAPMSKERDWREPVNHINMQAGKTYWET